MESTQTDIIAKALREKELEEEIGATIIESVLLIALIALVSLSSLSEMGKRIACVFQVTEDVLKTGTRSGLPLSQDPACASSAGSSSSGSSSSAANSSNGGGG